MEVLGLESFHQIKILALDVKLHHSCLTLFLVSVLSSLDELGLTILSFLPNPSSHYVLISLKTSYLKDQF